MQSRMSDDLLILTVRHMAGALIQPRKLETYFKLATFKSVQKRMGARARPRTAVGRRAASHARPRNEVVDLDSRSGGYEDLPSTA